MIQIISISLQLSAGLILLLWSFKNINENVIDLYFPGSNIAIRDEDNNVTLEKNRLREKMQYILYSIFSFIDLSLGFMLSIFAEQEHESCIVFTLVIIISLTIIIFEIAASNFLAKLKYKDDIVISYSELESRGVDTAMTVREIDESWNQIFNEV